MWAASFRGTVIVAGRSTGSLAGNERAAYNYLKQ